MGLIRGGIFTFVSVCFLISVLVGGIFLTIASSLKYSNVEVELTPVIKSLIETQVNLQDLITRKFSTIQKYCENNSEYILEQSQFSVSILCNEISQGTENIVDSAIKRIVKEKYYQDYQCEFWECFKSESLPFFIISQKAHDYWKAKFNLVFILSSIFFISMFFLSEKKSNALILAGGILILDSILLRTLSWLLLKLVLSSINSNLSIFSLDSFKFLIVSLGFVFIGMLILGFVLILFGVGFKLWIFFKEKEKPDTKEEIEKIVEEKIEKNRKTKKEK